MKNKQQLPQLDVLLKERQAMERIKYNLQTIFVSISYKDLKKNVVFFNKLLNKKAQNNIKLFADN